jgi:hypothetical protein
VSEPLCALCDFARSLRLRTHAGKAQKFFQSGDELAAVSVSILEGAPWIHDSTRNSGPAPSVR